MTADQIMNIPLVQQVITWWLVKLNRHKWIQVTEALHKPRQVIQHGFQSGTQQTDKATFNALVRYVDHEYICRSDRQNTVLHTHSQQLKKITFN